MIAESNKSPKPFHFDRSIIDVIESINISGNVTSIEFTVDYDKRVVFILDNKEEI